MKKFFAFCFLFTLLTVSVLGYEIPLLADESSFRMDSFDMGFHYDDDCNAWVEILNDDTGEEIVCYSPKPWPEWCRGNVVANEVGKIYYWAGDSSGFHEKTASFSEHSMNFFPETEDDIVKKVLVHFHWYTPVIVVIEEWSPNHAGTTHAFYVDLL